MIDREVADAQTSSLPEGRYKELVMDVLQRLPDLWDAYREYTFHLSEDAPEEGYAVSQLAEQDPETSPLFPHHRSQIWTVTLYTGWLDRLSDPAVRFVIAHELGHVVSMMSCPGRRTVKELPEIVADMIARAWGFWEEERDFNVDAPLLHE